MTAVDLPNNRESPRHEAFILPAERRLSQSEKETSWFEAILDRWSKSAKCPLEE